MMTPELTLLLGSAASLAFLHTLLGPDHYLPFVALGAARRWSRRRLLAVTGLCGLGHIAGSLLLGLLGLWLQWQFGFLQSIEGYRGQIAAWLLLGFGLAYLAWGLRSVWRKREHSHWHQHRGMVHRHQHDHHRDHAHPHDANGGLGPWVIFVIFVLGPCEPLIPLLLYPALQANPLGVIAVTGMFGLVTMVTMLAAVLVAATGLKALHLPGLARYSHALAGLTLVLCGSSIVALG